MKLIIDIDESLLDGIKSDNFDFARQVVRSFQGTIASSIANGTPIPDNATNGDVLKAMFPKDVKVITQHDDIFGRRFIDLRVGQLDCELDDEWWNSPYQKGGKG